MKKNREEQLWSMLDINFSLKHPSLPIEISVFHNDPHPPQLLIVKNDKNYWLHLEKRYRVHEISFSDDGNYFAIIQYGSVSVWNIQEDSVINTNNITDWAFQDMHAFYKIKSMSLNANAQWLATLSVNGETKVWNLASRKIGTWECAQGDSIFVLPANKSYEKIVFSSLTSISVYIREENKLVSDSLWLLPTQAILNPSQLKFLAFITLFKEHLKEASIKLSHHEKELLTQWDDDSRLYLELLIQAKD